MVQIIDDPYAGNIFGRLGAGLGKGVSESLPREIQNQRAASAFERLGDESLTPNQKIASLMRQGVSQEAAMNALPFLQENQKLENLKRGTFPGQSTETSVPTSLESEKNISVKPTKVPMNWEERINVAKQKQLQPPSPDEIYKMASELAKSGQAFSEQDALSKAKDVLEGRYKTQDTLIKDIRSEVSKRMATQLQGGGLGDFKDVQGAIQQEMLDRLEAQALEGGKNIATLEKEGADVINELGRTATQTKATGARSFLTTKPKAKIAAYRQQKKEFDKNDLGDYFTEIVADAEKISEMEAASFLQPLENKELKKEIDNLNTIKGKLLNRSPFKEVNKLNETTLDKMVSSIKPTDNLLSVAHELRKSKLDIPQFMDAVRKKFDEGNLPLTKWQQRQLQKPVTNSFIGDILFEAFK